MQYLSLFDNFNKNDQDSNRENLFPFNTIQIKKLLKNENAQSKMSKNRQEKLRRRVKKFIIESNDL